MQTIKYMQARIAIHDKQMHLLISVHESNAWYSTHVGKFLYFSEYGRNYGACNKSK